jgi:hypothetical protein
LQGVNHGVEQLIEWGDRLLLIKLLVSGEEVDHVV